MKRTQSKAVKPARKGAVKVPIQGRIMMTRWSKEKGLHAPAWLIPADPESYDAMVDRVAAVIWKSTEPEVAASWMPLFPCGEWRRRYLERAQLSLAAIGIRRNPRAARATTKGAVKVPSKLSIAPGITFTPFSESELVLLNKWANSKTRRNPRAARATTKGAE